MAKATPICVSRIRLSLPFNIIALPWVIGRRILTFALCRAQNPNCSHSTTGNICDTTAMAHPQQQQRLLDSSTEAADDAVSPIEPEGSLHGGCDVDGRRDDQSAADAGSSSFNAGSLREGSPRRSPNSQHHSGHAENDEDSEVPAAVAEGKSVEATHFWWYWDFAGALVAVICMVLIAVTLIVADGKALDGWSLLISPNTIVAVLTTVARTALLVPLGSSISQLKWRHLLLKAQPLNHIQLFDNASRGPWGSLLMIRRLLLQSRLVCALALATILTLAISPSAQQILEYPSLHQELPHINVAIGRADEYFSKGFRQVDGLTCKWS